MQIEIGLSMKRVKACVVLLPLYKHILFCTLKIEQKITTSEETFFLCSFPAQSHLTRRWVANLCHCHSFAISSPYTFVHFHSFLYDHFPTYASSCCVFHNDARNPCSHPVHRTLERSLLYLHHALSLLSEFSSDVNA